MINSDGWKITDGGRADYTPPMISFIAPVAGGSMMQPRALIIVEANDDFGINKIEFYGGVDEPLPLLFTDTNGLDGWKYQWATNDLGDASVSVKAIAYDACGNQALIQLDHISLTRTMTIGNGYETRGGGVLENGNEGREESGTVDFQNPIITKKTQQKKYSHFRFPHPFILLY